MLVLAPAALIGPPGRIHLLLGDSVLILAQNVTVPVELIVVIISTELISCSYLVSRDEDNFPWIQEILAPEPERAAGTYWLLNH
jgi:hypothetical protein